MHLFTRMMRFKLNPWDEEATGTLRDTTVIMQNMHYQLAQHRLSKVSSGPRRPSLVSDKVCVLMQICLCYPRISGPSNVIIFKLPETEEFSFSLWFTLWLDLE